MGDRVQYSKEKIEHIEKIPARILHQMVKDSECYVPLHWHKDIEINLMLMGEAIFTVNGKKQKVGPGDFIIINSEDLHMGEPSLSGKGQKEVYMELLTIQWDYDFLAYYAKQEQELRLELAENDITRKELRDKIISIGTLYIHRPLAYEMEITALLLEIGSLLIKNCISDNSDNFVNYTRNKIGEIQDAVTYINSNYMKKITLQEIASQSHLTAPYFSRKFKQVTGNTFHQYLTECRLKNSLNDLQNTSLNITEIAYNNGFPNVKSFIEEFKKKFQVTPQKYRGAT